MQLPLEKQISFLHIKKFIFHNLYSFVFLPFDFYMTSLVFGFKEYAFINKILCVTVKLMHDSNISGVIALYSENFLS